MTVLLKAGEVVSKLPPHLTYADGTLSIKGGLALSDPLLIVLDEMPSEPLSVDVGSGTEVKIIIEIRVEHATGQSIELNLIARRNARVKHLLVGEINGTATLLQNIDGYRDASLDLVDAFASENLTARVHVGLLEEGAEAKLRALAVSSETQSQTIDVLITHSAKNTFGDMTNIGIANKKGRIVLNGVEKIEKGMKNANAFQTLKGIILSDEARVEVNPILLIDEYDVKAGHGATIGKIDEDALYYLRSRGLTVREAERLIINGFLNPVINDIDDTAIRERFVELVNQRI